ncbi:MAG: hypothetical protein A2Z03_02910 [Chloroflexi bacterium RBG_16_56_8]|nr:MAG: hypothetical protein A2Z03_02910 [Chloroflexi bacterium RBG_16_56_8]
MTEQSRLAYFLDSSAIAKRYAEEVGTEWVETLCASHAGNIIALAHIGMVEVAAALAAKQRTNVITSSQYEDALTNLISDGQEQYRLVVVDKGVIDRAIQLARRRKLRGCDAIQLASALALNESLVEDNLPALTFVAADNDLIAAASGEGLATENPNLHP